MNTESKPVNDRIDDVVGSGTSDKLQGKAASLMGAV